MTEPDGLFDNAELSRYEIHIGGELAGWVEHRPELGEFLAESERRA